jgi:hypothetical protein
MSAGIPPPGHPVTVQSIKEIHTGLHSGMNLYTGIYIHFKCTEGLYSKSKPEYTMVPKA